MSWIEVGASVFVSALSGSAAFGLWRLEERFLEGEGRFREIRRGLIPVTLFFLAPAVFLFWKRPLRYLWGGEVQDFFWDAPALALSIRFLVILWVAGTFFAAARFVGRRRKVKRFLGRGRLAGRGIQEMAGEVRECFRIRRRIPVYMTDGLSGPVITGVLKCCVFLPKRSYGEEELRIILEHELWHYKQGDLFLKAVCGWLSCLEWFHPLCDKMSAEVDRWGEICCDLQMCYRQERPWNLRRYFQVVLEHAPERGAGCFPGMRLESGREELEERIRKMRAYQPEREPGRFSAALLAACFLLAAGGTSFAAGKGAGAVYGVVYRASQQEVRRGFPVRGKKGGSVKREEGHDWNLTAGEEKEAAVFHGEDGDQVAVLVSMESEDTPTKITLKGPDGSRRSVFGTGIHSFTFTVLESGEHGITVGNEGGEGARVWVTAIW